MATITRVVGDKPLSSNALKTTSELNGRIVAARKAAMNSPTYPSSEKVSIISKERTVEGRMSRDKNMSNA